jgi:hypothetical protein
VRGNRAGTDRRAASSRPATVGRPPGRVYGQRVDKGESRASLRDVALAAVGAGLQLASPGAAGTLAGAVLPPAMLLALRADERARQRRLERAARTLEVAAQELGVGLEEVEQLGLRDEEHTELLMRVLQASACAITAREKVEALGRVLADGLRHDEKFDEALLLAAALGDLEAPHVRTLRGIGQVWRGRGKGLHWDYREHAREWYTTGDMALAAGGSLAAPAVVGVLARHGLVEQATRDRRGINGVEREQVWSISALGTKCLVLLRVSCPVPRPASLGPGRGGPLVPPDPPVPRP